VTCFFADDVNTEWGWLMTIRLWAGKPLFISDGAGGWLIAKSDDCCCCSAAPTVTPTWIPDPLLTASGGELILDICWDCFADETAVEVEEVTSYFSSWTETEKASNCGTPGAYTFDAPGTPGSYTATFKLTFITLEEVEVDIDFEVADP